MISFKGVESLPFKKLNYSKIVKKVVFWRLAKGLEKKTLHKTEEGQGLSSLKLTLYLRKTFTSW